MQPLSIYLLKDIPKWLAGNQIEYTTFYKWRQEEIAMKPNPPFLFLVPGNISAVMELRMEYNDCKATWLCVRPGVKGGWGSIPRKGALQGNHP